MRYRNLRGAAAAAPRWNARNFRAVGWDVAEGGAYDNAAGPGDRTLAADVAIFQELDGTVDVDGMLGPQTLNVWFGAVASAQFDDPDADESLMAAAEYLARNIYTDDTGMIYGTTPVGSRGPQDSDDLEPVPPPPPPPDEDYAPPDYDPVIPDEPDDEDTDEDTGGGAGPWLLGGAAAILVGLAAARGRR